MAGSVARTKLELSEAATEQNLLQEGADIPLLPTQPGGNAAGSSSRWSARSVEEIRQEKARLQKVAEEKKIKVRCSKDVSIWIRCVNSENHRCKVDCVWVWGFLDTV
eukprot:1148164-Pelagomonas_calceolata.AAC.3